MVFGAIKEIIDILFYDDDELDLETQKIKMKNKKIDEIEFHKSKDVKIQVK